MKIFITKYALANGIIETEADELKPLARFAVVQRGGHSSYFHRKEFHLSLEEAQEHAQKMVLGHIEKLEKALKKVKKLQGKPFEVRLWSEER
jgi:hypothetical protein